MAAQVLREKMVPWTGDAIRIPWDTFTAPGAESPGNTSVLGSMSISMDSSAVLGMSSMLLCSYTHELEEEESDCKVPEGMLKV
ncbi:hypothetical protein H920_00819 [Fukomys damarensis]|uniref:Uncharacterized protein n=1 Tax=Fukomys damarensis TaxID=885580 RepID=A0A091E2V6_FUKDA|nr:hypothetical protein H920_00819 [Fukomys damarensis]